MALFPTYVKREMVPAKGEGNVLIDEQGKRYLDFTSGLGVCNLGHCHPRVTAALTEQASCLWHVSNLFPIPIQQRVAERLTQATGMGAAFFCNSGAEANEAAIKLVRKAAQEKRGITNPEILTFKGSFHGRTLATLTATGQEKVKTGFSPLPAGFVTIAPEMEAVREATHEQTAAVMLELVQGEGGVCPIDPTFLQELVLFCHERGLLLVVDEIQTGMGRTGTLFAAQQYGLHPDVMTVAKGLGNGLPVGAMLARAELKEHFGVGSHGTTFGGNPLVMAAANAVLEELEQESLLGQVREMGEYLCSLLQERIGEHPAVTQIRGMGLMIGIQLLQEAGPIITSCEKEGLLVLPAGPNVIRLLPPLLVTKEEVKVAVTTLAHVLTRQMSTPQVG
ncbi:acetylornithine transaminase [Mechercharimyces sp. CAU 1602]|uniref:acetylornithine transaminase n=1 Tax=Mechercharimyces sp. CAU 1602 TaxID=2973933 RepID=UPI00216234C7|nr:acetylornithine transaminase [Mechercharimyces sp. CAU 1602]MCS1350073.1 acetylornithine transaminase [Mechercharimyces sp. CAU 1602]